MATTEPVRVTVEIIEKFEDDLERLEKRLDKIDGKRLNVGLEINDKEIEKVEAKLKELEDRLSANLNIDVKGYEKALAMKEALEKDMHSTLHIDTKRGRGLGLGLDGIGGKDGTDPPTPKVSKEVIENLTAIHGPSSAMSRMQRRFNDDELSAINDFLINPAVAKAHNKGIPADQRDGWIGPSNWGFGLGEKWGPSAGGREKTPAQDFLDNIASAMRGSKKVRIDDARFSKARFGDMRFKARGFDPDHFMRGRGGGNYPWSPSQRIGRQAGRLFGYGSNPDLTAGLLRRRGRAGLGRAASGAATAFGFLSSGGDGGNEDTPMYQRHFAGVGKAFKKFSFANMRNWYRLVAALLPIMIALAGAAVGVVAAFGAIATAGAAMLGIGLLGFGDSLEESLGNVKKRIGELKKDLFGVLQPAAATFQPFVEQLFDAAPGLVQKFVEPLQRLMDAGYDSFFLDSLEGAANWFADLLGMASELAPQIQALGAAIGSAFGAWLTDFLRRMTLELHDNWDSWVRLTRAFLAVIHLLYELSKVVAFTLSLLEPLFTWIGGLADVLGNRFLSALLAAIVAMWALDFVLAAVAAKVGYATFAAMAQGIWAAVTAVGGLSGVMAVLSAALDVIIAKLASINLLTGGLLLLTGLVVGGLAYTQLGKSTPDTPNQGRGYGGGGYQPGPAGTTVNIYGDVGNKEYQRLKDEFPSMYEEQSTIERNTTK